MPVVRVYIVRHGETEENRTGVMQGQLDTELNAAGIEQAILTANALEKVSFVQAHSSDLSRAIKTAEIILEGHATLNVPVLHKHAALRERYMGDMEGKPMSEWKGPLPENIEPGAMFAARADKWWKSVVVRCLNSVGRGRTQILQGGQLTPEHPVLNILVVSHGGLIRTLLQGLIGSRKVVYAEPGVAVDQSGFRCPNASVTVIEMDRGGKGTLVMLADTTHLDVELVEGNVDVVEDGDEHRNS